MPRVLVHMCAIWQPGSPAIMHRGKKRVSQTECFTGCARAPRVHANYTPMRPCAHAGSLPAACITARGVRVSRSTLSTFAATLLCPSQRSLVCMRTQISPATRMRRECVHKHYGGIKLPFDWEFGVIGRPRCAHCSTWQRDCTHIYIEHSLSGPESVHEHLHKSMHSSLCVGLTSWSPECSTVFGRVIAL